MEHSRFACKLPRQACITSDEDIQLLADGQHPDPQHVLGVQAGTSWLIAKLRLNLTRASTPAAPADGFTVGLLLQDLVPEASLISSSRMKQQNFKADCPANFMRKET